MTHFRRSLKRLKFNSYNDYLSSSHWSDFKEKYRKSGRTMICAVCDRSPIQLHHHDYRNIGHESIWDVTPLCRVHHEEVHEWLKTNEKGLVGYTANAVTALRRRFFSANPPPLPIIPNRKKVKPSPEQLAESDPKLGDLCRELKKLSEEGRIKSSTIFHVLSTKKPSIIHRAIEKAMRRPIGVFNGKKIVELKVILPPAVFAELIDAKAKALISQKLFDTLRNCGNPERVSRIVKNALECDRLRKKHPKPR